MARVLDTCWVMASTAVTMVGLMLMAGRKLCRKGSSSSVAPGKGGACVGTQAEGLVCTIFCFFIGSGGLECVVV